MLLPIVTQVAAATAAEQVLVPTVRSVMIDVAGRQNDALPFNPGCFNQIRHTGLFALIVPPDPSHLVKPATIG